MSLALVSLVVSDYDEAIGFFCDGLGFEVAEDRDEGHKRWVVVQPSDGGTGLVLAKASTDDQAARVGDQTGGRVGFFLHTNDFAGQHQRMVDYGVRFLEEPRYESYGTVAVFEDLYGNKWDLLEPAAARRPDDAIGSLDDLLARYGAANPTALTKQTKHITAEYRAVIEASPFVGLATIGPEGMDCSPRGDDPNVVTVVDERTVHLPDRRGNNRLDSLRNIVLDGRVALLFLIPGIPECLRINGTAVLRTDPDLLQSYAVGDRLPASVIEITTEAVYYQCARAVKRSKLWDPARQIERGTIPTPGEITSAIDETFDGEAYESALQQRQADTLY